MEASNRALIREQLCHPHQVQDGDGFSVLGSIRKGNVMFSIYLKDACFQIPIHSDSQSYIHTTLNGKNDEWKKIEKESGYAVCALLPKKDERYKRRGVKVEPKWLGMGEYVIFRTLELKFLGRSYYKKWFHQDHMPSHIWWKRFEWEGFPVQCTMIWPFHSPQVYTSVFSLMPE